MKKFVQTEIPHSLKNFKLKGISPRVNKKRQIVGHAAASLGRGSKEKPSDGNFSWSKRHGHDGRSAQRNAYARAEP